MIGKVDCVAESVLANKYGINKYPTLKLFRYGVLSKKEYRGARTVDAFLAYIQTQSADTVKEINSIPDYINLEVINYKFMYFKIKKLFLISKRLKKEL